MTASIPVVLFTYARPQYMKRTLACLRENRVPLIYAFSDGPKTPEVGERVNEVRQMLREIDWCEVHLVERTENLGLGKSILAGVTEVFEKHDAIIVFEDDLICVPGTYPYLCAALEHYMDNPKVMSVTGFNHPLNTPKDITDQPYFDGRTDCLVWGSWARAWNGMETPALKLMKQCEEKGISPYKYGAVLPELAQQEKSHNTWAVRFAYKHILVGGLCLRPPYSMVEHLGFDQSATNAPVNNWPAPPLGGCPPIPEVWPQPVEHPECSVIWQKVDGGTPLPQSFGRIVKTHNQRIRKFINANFSIKRKFLNWVGESPSTRDIRLMWYQFKKTGLKSITRKYDNLFYEEHTSLKPGYIELAKEVMLWFTPTSVCDLGCGNGFLIEYLYDNGVSITGVEGNSTSLKFMSEKIRERILIRDLMLEHDLGRYDLVISTEVAEHLPKSGATTFVRNITRTGEKSILFSAAPPGQWGDGHINCQPKSFWVAKFEQQGWQYQALQTQKFTNKIKGNTIIADNMPWLLDNFMIFSRADAAKSNSS